MLSRRRFLTLATAGAASFATVPDLRAQDKREVWDVVIRGGRVIDPSRRFDQQADIGIRAGKIAAIRHEVTGVVSDVIDATGKLVVPGLIDIHTHAGREKEDPGLCLADGVTSLVDAGSAGSDAIEDVVAIAKAAPSRMRVLINISKKGIITGRSELEDLANVDVAATRAAIVRHRDVIVGIKARLSKNVAGANDVPALKLAQQIARPLNIPIMIHMGQTVSPLPDILAVLKPGDIVTHMYAPPPNGIFGTDGKLISAVTDARKRGVWFDFGNGRLDHWTWAIAEHAMQERVLPDTFSTDWGQAARTDQVFDFATVMSKFLLLGMPIDEVIARATSNAAKTFPAFKGLGTIRPGSPADVAVLELRQGSFEFEDNYKGKRTGSQKLVASATVLGGKSVFKRG
jgi:dihydroorotase